MILPVWLPRTPYKHNNNNNTFDKVGKYAEKKLDSSPDETRTFGKD
jgi:hypothetical protein